MQIAYQVYDLHNFETSLGLVFTLLNDMFLSKMGFILGIPIYIFFLLSIVLLVFFVKPKFIEIYVFL